MTRKFSPVVPVGGYDVEWIDAEPIDLRPANGFGGPDWARMRKAEPYGKITPLTAYWAKALPPQVKPVALMEKYPRIANMLAANWPDPLARWMCLEDLLHDGRGDRKGFAPQVAEDLDILRMFHTLGPRIRAVRHHG